MNVDQLITCHQLAEEKRGFHVKEEDLGALSKGWFYLVGDKIAEVGEGSPPQELQQKAQKVSDLKGFMVLPGLIDSHTHPLYGGDRAHEFLQRLQGLSYEEIATRGGGIQYTVQKTKEASDNDLKKSCHKRLSEFLDWGVTTVEVKSGYGLTVEEELRQLRLYKEVDQEVKQTLYRTCLALHAIPPHLETSVEDYVTKVSKELLPQVAEESLAKGVDIFIERGYFSEAQSETYLSAGKSLGFDIRIHADEFSRSGGSQAAVRWQAKSADHLQAAEWQDYRDLANAGVVSTILPGTSLYTKIPYCDGRKMSEAGCAIAIATDHNPGSSMISQLPFIGSLAGIHCGLTGAQVIAGMTYVPALSLGLEKDRGAIVKGYRGDFVVLPCSNYGSWLYHLGQIRPAQVWIGGVKVRG